MSNDSARVRVTGPQAGKPESDPLLPVSRKELALTRTGKMEAEGVRERTPVKVSEFESQYRQPEDKTPVLTKVKEAIAKQRAKFSFQRALVSNFPILSALKKYKPLRDLPNDVVAGLTAGIMMIPQGGNAFCNSLSYSSPPPPPPPPVCDVHYRRRTHTHTQRVHTTPIILYVCGAHRHVDAILIEWCSFPSTSKLSGSNLISVIVC